MLRANARDMRWTFAEMIACASQNAMLYPGDLIAAGAAGTDIRLEQPRETQTSLQPGDIVRLEVEGLGLLENPIA